MSSTETTERVRTDSWTPQPLDWPPPPAPTAPAAATRLARRLPVVAVLVGLLCGAFVVGSVWLGESLLAKPTAVGPSANAADACTIIEGLPAFTTADFTLSDGSKLYAASELSAAAAREDQRYRRLAEATRQAYLASSDLTLESVNEQVSVALTECARRVS